MAKKPSKAGPQQLPLPGAQPADRQARKAAIEAKRRRGGRPRKPPGERKVEHLTRPAHAKRYPLHINVSVKEDVPNLRAKKLWRVVRRVVVAAAQRFGQMFRIVEYSVQGNHLHLIVEAHNQRELSRGMQGFGIRLAKNLNLRLQRQGALLHDRYFARELRNPLQTARAIDYVRRNMDLHRYRASGRAAWLVDAYSTQHQTLRAELPAAGTWLVDRARTLCPDLPPEYLTREPW